MLQWIKNKFLTYKLKSTYNTFLKQSRVAPRVTLLANTFELIARGQLMVPNPKPRPNLTLLHNDQDVIACCQYIEDHLGIFAAHYYASIPYSMEQDARVISAINKYFYNKIAAGSQDLCFYEPSGETGTTSRLITAISHSKVNAICCSVTKANEDEFYRLRETNSSAHFYLGPFTDVTPKYLARKRKGLECFAHGFDIVYERSTLQMYGANRMMQLYHLRRIVKDDGVLILQGKYLTENMKDYFAREKFKDQNFKAKYFDQAAIISKDTTILQTMQKGQVTIDEIVDAIKPNFKHAVIIWNSGNFYTLMVSDSSENIYNIISNMVEPCIPDEFNFDGPLPKVLLGLNENRLTFYKTKTMSKH